MNTLIVEFNFMQLIFCTCSVMRIFCIFVLFVSCVEELNDALSKIKSPSDVTVVEKGLASLLNIIDNEGKAGISNLQCFVSFRYFVFVCQYYVGFASVILDLCKEHFKEIFSD